MLLACHSGAAFEGYVILGGSWGVIVHGGDRVFYWTREARIQLPLPEQFRISESKFATAVHELTHWRGQMSRLDRYLTGRFGPAAYASDLLVAENGVPDLCAAGAGFTCLALPLSCI